MIQVKLPDGSTAQFPDGTPNDVMTKAIQAKFPPQVAAAQPQTPPAAPAGQSLGSDVSQGLSGFNEGLADFAGSPVELVNGALRAGAAGVHALGGPDVQFSTDPVGGQQFFRNLMSPTIAPPTSDPTGQFVRRVGNDLGASAIPGMGAAAMASRPLATLAVNLGTSLAGGTGAATANAVAPGNKYAELAGEMAGDFVPGRMAAVGRRLITPFPASPERAAFADTMAKNGVDLTAGQATGSKTLQYAENELGGGAAADMAGKQGQQFTQAVLAKAGISAPRATPEVMKQAFSDIGDRFNTLTANTSIIPDKQLGADLKSALSDYRSIAGSDERPIIANTLNDIKTWAANGQITGAQYKSLSTRISTALDNTSNPELTGALREVKGALDDAVGRSLAKTSPDALADWQQTRRDYANLMRIKDAAAGAGDATAGIISPQRLRQVLSAKDSKGYVTGRGDLNDLARAGVQTMSPLPNSGTAPRLMVHQIPSAIGAALGSMAGLHAGGMEGMGIGAGIGTLAPYAAGRAMLSGPGRAYLANQLMGPAKTVPNGYLGALSAALISKAGMM